jgi:hypothetical protein
VEINTASGIVLQVTGNLVEITMASTAIHHFGMTHGKEIMVTDSTLVVHIGWL